LAEASTRKTPAIARGVGEHEASAKAESEAGGFEGVAAGRYVVHEIGLAERQHLASAGKVVLLGRYRAKRQLVASALGLHGLRAVDVPVVPARDGKSEQVDNGKQHNPEENHGETTSSEPAS
jgi:hypothetical protein